MKIEKVTKRDKAKVVALLDDNGTLFLPYESRHTTEVNTITLGGRGRHYGVATSNGSGKIEEIGTDSRMKIRVGDTITITF